MSLIVLIYLIQNPLITQKGSSAFRCENTWGESTLSVEFDVSIKNLEVYKADTQKMLCPQGGFYF